MAALLIGVGVFVLLFGLADLVIQALPRPSQDVDETVAIVIFGACAALAGLAVRWLA